MTKTLSNIAKFGAGVSLLAMAPALAAQDDEAKFGFEEITVTANKREQAFDEVPISISAVSGDDLQNFMSGGADIRTLAARVPGLNAESSNGRIGPRFYIRGLGNTDFDLAASQPVGVVMDDIFQENVILKSFPIFDVERVEVLRGPQGTLFGRNTPAGLVKIDSVKPGEELDGYVRLNAGERETLNFEGAVGGALTDKIQARFSMLYQHRGDYIDNGFTGEDSFTGGYDDLAGRLHVNIDFTDDFSTLFTVKGRSLDGVSGLFRANVLTTGSNQLNDNYDRNTVFYDTTAEQNVQNYDSWGASATSEWRINENMTLTNIVGYEATEGSSIGDVDGGNLAGVSSGFVPFPSSTQDAITDLDQWSEELRFAHQASEKLFYQVGFYYFSQEFNINTNPFFVPASDVNHDNEAFGVFGQFTYEFNDKTSFTGGLRYTDDERTVTGFSGAFGAPLDPIDLDGDRVSWDASINHFVTEDVSVYARVAEGFRAPTVQGRDVAFFGVPTTAGSEVVTSYEIGYKATLLENTLRWNGSFFYYDVSGQQVTAVGGATNSVQLVSVDEVIGYGFETDIEWLASEYLTLLAGFSYNNTEINDEGLRVGTCGAPCTVTNPVDENGFAFVDGNPLPQAPEITVNAVIDFHYPVDDGDEIFWITDFALTGETNLLIYESEEFRTNGNFELGMRAGYRWDGGKYEVAVFARNLTGEDNILGVVDFNNLTAYLNEPRVIGVSLGANF